jgi:hypothetical protein
LPRTTLVAGTTITASWANANVRDQVITPFASASARDSSWTSPIEGAYAHLNDTNKLTHYNGAAWVPATSNIVAFQNLTGSSSVFTTDATTDFSIANVVVRVERLYKVTMHSQWSISAAGTWNVNLHVDGTLTDRMTIVNAGGSTSAMFDCAILWQPTSGTKTVDLRVDETGGTGDLQFIGEGAAVNTRWFYIEDIGPR